MVQYLARFSPNLASDLQPLRKLTRKVNSGYGLTNANQLLQKVKDKISKALVLTLYNSNDDLDTPSRQQQGWSGCMSALK